MSIKQGTVTIRRNALGTILDEDVDLTRVLNVRFRTSKGVFDVWVGEEGDLQVRGMRRLMVTPEASNRVSLVTVPLDWERVIPDCDENGD